MGSTGVETTGNRGSINVQVLGKYTSCEEDFVLAPYVTTFFFCWRSSVLIVLPACENQVALLLKMLITPLWSKRKTSQKDQFRSYGQFELPVHVIGVRVCCISEVCEAVKTFGFVWTLNFVWKSTFAWKLSFVWKYHLFFVGGGGGGEKNFCLSLCIMQS